MTVYGEVIPLSKNLFLTVMSEDGDNSDVPVKNSLNENIDDNQKAKYIEMVMLKI